MMRKENWSHLLVYNLLHTVMAQAALGHGLGRQDGANLERCRREAEAGL